MRTAAVVILLGVWTALLVTLVQRQGPPVDAQPLVLDPDVLRAPERVARDEWFGVYREERKIGWAHRTTTRGEEGLVFRDDADFRLAMLGIEQHVRTSLVAETDRELNLRSFRFRMVSPAATFSAHGEVTDDAVRIEHGSGNGTNQLVLPLTEPIHLPSTVRSSLALWEAEPGDRWATTVFSPMTMRNETLAIVVRGREVIDGPEGPVETVHVVEEHQGLAASAWIDRKGATIRETATLGFRLQRETPSAAVSGIDGGLPVDLALENRIPFRGTIDDPRASTRLRLAVGGAAAGRIPDDPPRQRVVDGVLEIERESWDDTAGSWLPPRRADSEPSPFIESRAPEIVEQARAIVAGETDPRRKARLLVDWTRAHLTQEPSVTLPSARAVLARKRGDCNEHAVLLAALARAAGIPARVVAGVVYADDGFYYHAWNELWLGRWISADAIFGQMPTDATHVKFLEGGPERHVELAEVVGQLEFTRMEDL